jgi:hypothetical protein
MSDGVVSDRFQTRGGNELSSHDTKEYLGERTVSSLNSAGSRYSDVMHGWYVGVQNEVKRRRS